MDDTETKPAPDRPEPVDLEMLDLLDVIFLPPHLQRQRSLAGKRAFQRRYHFFR